MLPYRKMEEVDMMQKKHYIYGLCVILAIVSMPIYNIYASSPYEGREGEWLSRCAVPQENEQAAQECRDFKTYYTQQSNNLEQKVDDMKKSSYVLNADLSNLSTLIEQLNTQIDGINAEISVAEEVVNTMRSNIINLDIKMAEKQEEINRLDALVKARMVKEQGNIGTNRYIDVIMGANDLMDFIRMIEGINLITESDQEQINAADKARDEFKLQQEEQVRLEEDMETQLAEIETRKDAVAQGKAEQEKMYAQYYEKQQSIMREMETAQADINSMQGSIAGINTNVRDDIFEKPDDPENPSDPENPDQPEMGDGNKSWLKPISYARYCGTWYYPNSSVDHVGTDYSGPIGAAVRAPADSIVLYANDPFGANQFGQYLGWPYGGGNSMHLLTQVNGITYGVSFFHMSPGFLVSAGDLVKQGQVVSYSGNSGNSYGAHLHVEVLNLGTMSITEAQRRFANTADFAWGTGWTASSACSVRSAPCRERPEEIFGY